MNSPTAQLKAETPKSAQAMRIRPELRAAA